MDSAAVPHKGYFIKRRKLPGCVMNHDAGRKIPPHQNCLLATGNGPWLVDDCAAATGTAPLGRPVHCASARMPAAPCAREARCEDAAGAAGSRRHYAGSTAGLAGALAWRSQRLQVAEASSCTASLYARAPPPPPVAGAPQCTHVLGGLDPARGAPSAAGTRGASQCARHPGSQPRAATPCDLCSIACPITPSPAATAQASSPRNRHLSRRTCVSWQIVDGRSCM